MSVVSYRDLMVWRRAMELAEEVYRLSRLLPKAEEYRLTSQVLRSAVSVPANIAEGHACSGPREFLNFLSIAGGSLAETETLLMLAVRARLLPLAEISRAMGLAEEVGRMLPALKKSLRAKTPTKRPSRP